jgi:hypothetical protein
MPFRFILQIQIYTKEFTQYCELYARGENIFGFNQETFLHCSVNKQLIPELKSQKRSDLEGIVLSS